MNLTLRSQALCALALVLSLTSTPALAQQAGGTGPNYETRLSTLEDNMRTLNGQLEQVGYAIKRLDQSLQRMQGDYDARLTKLESAVTALAAAPPPQPAPAPEPAPPAASKIQPDTSADSNLTPQEQYEHALDLVRKTNYAEAEKAFKSFVDKNPKDKLIDNAKYWYGETLYVQGRYDESAIAFADAFQQNPQSPKAPDSLLKLAMSLSYLNKVQDACTTLNELKSKYPNAPTNVRSLADEQRAKLKCGAH